MVLYRAEIFVRLQVVQQRYVAFGKLLKSAVVCHRADLLQCYGASLRILNTDIFRPILSVFFALIVHSELKSVHPGFPVAFIF